MIIKLSGSVSNSLGKKICGATMMGIRKEKKFKSSLKALAFPICLLIHCPISSSSVYLHNSTSCPLKFELPDLIRQTPDWELSYKLADEYQIVFNKTQSSGCFVPCCRWLLAATITSSVPFIFKSKTRHSKEALNLVLRNSTHLPNVLFLIRRMHIWLN